MTSKGVYVCVCVVLRWPREKVNEEKKETEYEFGEKGSNHVKRKEKVEELYGRNARYQ